MDLSRFINGTGTLALINFVRKHADKLRQSADPVVQAHGERVAAGADALERAYQERRPLRAAWVETTLLKDLADDALDELIASISHDLLGLCGRNRRALAYRVLFPDGTLQFTYGPDREELVQVRGMVSYLDEHPEHPLAGRKDELAQAAQALDAALSPQAQAEAAFRSAQAKERTERSALTRALRKSARFLRDHLDGDEAKVEALFPPIPAKPEPDPAEPTGPGEEPKED
jgi:hypothetical protein